MTFYLYTRHNDVIEQNSRKEKQNLMTFQTVLVDTATLSLRGFYVTNMTSVTSS